MTGKQKKLIEHWLVLGAILVIVTICQSAGWNAQLALIPLTIYAVVNWGYIREFQRRSLKPGEIIEQSSKVKIWVYLSSAILLAVALAFLLSGLDILDYLGFGTLLLLVALPLLPIIVISQVALYRNLANEL